MNFLSKSIPELKSIFNISNTNSGDFGGNLSNITPKDSSCLLNTKVPKSLSKVMSTTFLSAESLRTSTSSNHGDSSTIAVISTPDSLSFSTALRGMFSSAKNFIFFWQDVNVFFLQDRSCIL